jgi:hypothetical protein
VKHLKQFALGPGLTLVEAVILYFAIHKGIQGAANLFVAIQTAWAVLCLYVTYNAIRLYGGEDWVKAAEDLHPKSIFACNMALHVAQLVVVIWNAWTFTSICIVIQILLTLLFRHCAKTEAAKHTAANPTSPR